MKISVIGEGEAGQAITSGLAKLGHDVTLGCGSTNKKDIVKIRKLVSGDVQVESYADAADSGDIIFLVVAWHSAENVLSLIRPELAGKIVIDITNPIAYDESGAPQLAVGHDMSGGELVQQALSDSHVVKALNTINYRHVFNPSYNGASPTTFMCGNNASAKKAVAKLLQEFGWLDVQDIGSIQKSRLLEPLSLLWIEYGVINDTWDHAFAVLRS